MMSYFSIIISGVASLGVFVALILGIFFLVLSGLRWVSKVRSAFYEEELLRQKRRLFSKSCFDRDGEWPLMETNKPSNKNHECFSLENQLRDVLENLKDEKEEENSKKQSSIAPHTLLFRELIEKKIEDLIGGSLDGVPVGRYSTHSSYLALFCKYHSLLCQEIEKLGLALQSSILNEDVIDSEVSNHQILGLKKLLKEIISDILSLPTISEILFDNEITNSSNQDDFHDKTYEDILATAILNKVIGHFKNSTDGDILSLYQSNCQNEKSSEKYEEESISNSDSSDFSQMENVSFTLEEHIEEISNEYDLSDDDENVENCEFESNFEKSSFSEPEKVSHDDHVLKKAEKQLIEEPQENSTSSWEDNWLFQKKRFRSTPNVHHPVPVPMLVPKPSNNFRALVGGIDADDLSDMSDCSDSVFESRLVTLTDTDKDDLSDESDKLENKRTVNHIIDQTTDTSKIKEQLLIEFQSNNKCDSIKIQKPKELFSKNSEKNTFSNDYELKEKALNFSKSFDSNTTFLQVQSHVVTELKKEEEEREVEHVKEDGETKIWNDSEIITRIEDFSENIKENENYRTETNFNELLNFPDDTMPSLSSEYRFLRDYYVNASKNPSGMISPKILNTFTEEIEQVSKQKYENLSSQRNKVCRRNSIPFRSARETKWHSFPTIERRIKQNKSWFSKNHHNFVLVDKKRKKKQENNIVSKYQSEFRSLNLIKVTKSSNHKILSLEHFSTFEEKALRENLSHFLMRARGASPNFILNPIFMPDINDFKSLDYSYIDDDKEGKFSKEKNIDTNLKSLISYKQDIQKDKFKNDKEIVDMEGRKSRESGYNSDIIDYSI